MTKPEACSTRPSPGSAACTRAIPRMTRGSTPARRGCAVGGCPGVCAAAAPSTIAATAAELRTGRPAHHAGDAEFFAVAREHRRAGIAGAGAEAGALVVGRGIDQPDLQGARLAGRDQRDDTQRPAALAVAAHRDAV